ncbi:RagB/SusD family nutrient uptake outer membrane protein [Chryseobacterium sp. FH1]|uniref:RagB/SusD family nutrient uptake outer membrane protein n=1 Tax=Chryseobacterium sp. FH1 TaxID=1233951 RepID=UPI0004E2C032|nr:RagB/SusD family nutrient uptake outer membrane protein [Chryseobacterium sp. FH1]KFC20648.1 starch-binding protein [Chryseobacterium sp. FH1]
MKNIIKKGILATAFSSLLITGACSDVLEEQPRATYTPEYFQTSEGVLSGLTSMYAHLRYIYGQAYFYNATITGTDEVTYAQSADENFKTMDYSGQGNVNPATAPTSVVWNTVFSNINTANGVLKFGEQVGIAPNLLAEARFFRAFDYFLLVQEYGGAPLDLGAGDLQFNTNPVRSSVRNTVPEVYTKVVFPDLIKAIEDLPASPRLTGAVAKTTARLYLAKAYLTYAWWLENPRDIPTYPLTPRTDPDGHDAKWYFQKAYDIAVSGIDSPGVYGLQATYYDVNVAINDRNKEVLLYADHTENSEFYNGSSLTYSNGSAPENFASWMLTWNYTNIRSSSSATTWTPVPSVQREAVQALGRPWTRMAPTIGAVVNTFADKTNDSRYDGTFTTTYRGNWNKDASTNNFQRLYNANSLEIRPGDAIFSFLNDEPSQSIAYPTGAGKSNIGAGELPGRADFVVSPKGISRIVYPGIWKIGPYRTDSGAGLGQPNAASTRPFNIAKFSELYFIAAEAVVKGATPQAGKSARELVNVIRARAGKWRWDNNGNVAKVQDNSAQMTAATPAIITIDYILAEKSREYFGEGYRWYDLVRTQKWEELAGSYQIGGNNYGDHTAQTVNRNIQKFHYLHPIPQLQLDRMGLTPAEKAAYQNPGY